MDRDSVERLRFDRRLQRRIGWVEPAQVDAYLESLPDVSSKMTTCAEEEGAGASEAARDRREPSASAAGTAPAPAAPASEAPASSGDDSGPV